MLQTKILPHTPNISFTIRWRNGFSIVAVVVEGKKKHISSKHVSGVNVFRCINKISAFRGEIKAQTSESFANVRGFTD